MNKYNIGEWLNRISQNRGSLPYTITSMHNKMRIEKCVFFLAFVLHYFLSSITNALLKEKNIISASGEIEHLKRVHAATVVCYERPVKPHFHAASRGWSRGSHTACCRRPHPRDPGWRGSVGCMGQDECGTPRIGVRGCL